MFVHHFKYSVITLFKNKMLIFWVYAFPIILGTLFQMAFSNVENSEKFHAFDIAIVESDAVQNNEIYREAFRLLSDEQSDHHLFNIQYVTEDTAKELLDNQEIAGYVVLTDPVNVIVNSSGAEETVLKYAVEEIAQQEAMIHTLINADMQGASAAEQSHRNPEEIYQQAMALIQDDTVNIEDVSGEHLSYIVIEFYTLIAMACLYGGILGMVSINNSLANMSNQGKRISVSPAPKAKLILSSVLASYVAQLIGLFILFVYIVLVLKVDFGNHLPFIMLLTLAGSLAGLSLGILVATGMKANENSKTGILISVTMCGCFLSGMMGVSMKYIIDTHLPVLNKINPASMITDGFYALYYYDTPDRYYQDLISLFVFSGLLILLSIVSLRRQQYDCI
ncbi:MAG: ABC transporter permease [Lachnospiraceae bacterium]